ncbi:MAG: hypothetical protein HZB25_13360 [Candidatus Eisenbacteria bacterium]|nr:hypothetical protein [Candidatus Eisenbacteria bacterium]
MRDTRSIVWGLALVLLGATLLLARLGAVEVSVETLWPAIPVLFGVAYLAEQKLGSAVTFLLLGAVCFGCNEGWRGMSFEQSWPLLIVAVGAGIVVGAFEEREAAPRRRHAQESAQEADRAAHAGAGPATAHPHAAPVPPPSHHRAHRASNSPGHAAWFALAAVLGTTFAWFAVLAVLPRLHLHAAAAHPLGCLVALGHAAIAVVVHLWPALPLLVLAGMMLAIAVGRATNPRNEVRHDG